MGVHPSLAFTHLLLVFPDSTLHRFLLQRPVPFVLFFTADQSFPQPFPGVIGLFPRPVLYQPPFTVGRTTCAITSIAADAHKTSHISSLLSTAFSAALVSATSVSKASSSSTISAMGRYSSASLT